MIFPLSNKSFPENMPQLSSEKWAWIFTLLEEDYLPNFITTKENVHKFMVLRIRQRKEKTDSFENKPKSDHSHVFSVHTKWQILQLIALNKCFMVVDIQKQLKNFENIHVFMTNFQDQRIEEVKV